MLEDRLADTGPLELCDEYHVERNEPEHQTSYQASNPGYERRIDEENTPEKSKQKLL